MLKTARRDSEKDNNKDDSPVSTPKMSGTQIDEPIVSDLKLPTRPGFKPPIDFPPLPVYPSVVDLSEPKIPPIWPPSKINPKIQR